MAFEDNNLSGKPTTLVGPDDEMFTRPVLIQEEDQKLLRPPFLQVKTPGPRLTRNKSTPPASGKLRPIPHPLRRTRLNRKARSEPTTPFGLVEPDFDHLDPDGLHNNAGADHGNF